MLPRRATDDDDKPEPFPALSPVVSSNEQRPPATQNAAAPARPASPSVGATQSSTGRTRKTRGASLLQSIVNSAPPLGVCQAIGERTSNIPTLPEIKNGSYSSDGWSYEGQLENREYDPHDIQLRRITKRPRASTNTGEESGLRRRADEEGDAVLTEEHDELRTEVDVQQPLNRSGTAPATLAGYYTTTNTQKPSTFTRSTTQPSPIGTAVGPDEGGTYPNGYRFPKKHTWTQSIALGAAAFGKLCITPFGFLLTLYGLNVVAWGAMIFFVLLGAAPAMCPYPYNKAGGIPCSNHYSPKSKWIEYDSQILTALFTVTGFGLLPWRLRDFYYLLRWRMRKDQNGHRKLAGIYNGWYRLPGSQELPVSVGPPPTPQKSKARGTNSKEQELAEEALPVYTDEEFTALYTNAAVPLPPWKMPEPPLTGIRATPTKSWNLDLLIWAYLLNSAFQVGLSGIMWGMTRFNRPAWATALLIVLGFGTGIAAGVVGFKEGKKVKAVEGVPVKEYDVLESVEEFRQRKAKEEKKQQKKHKQAEHAREKNNSGDVIKQVEEV